MDTTGDYIFKPMCDEEVLLRQSHLVFDDYEYATGKDETLCMSKVLTSGPWHLSASAGLCHPIIMSPLQWYADRQKNGPSVS